MSDTFNAVTTLVALGKVRVSDHGYDELAADNILVADALMALPRVSWSRIIRSSRKDRRF
jgi:hypothetical protein